MQLSDIVGRKVPPIAWDEGENIPWNDPEFSKRVGATGWIGLTWPKKYGGAERSYIDRTILMEALMRYQAPLVYHFFGERQMGTSLMHYGSEELKAELEALVVILQEFQQENDSIRVS